jgi:hypothetical protein
MQMIRPITISQSNLTSNVALDDGAQYSVAATYDLGDVVINTAGTDPTYHAFESLVASNVGNALTDSAKWLDLGAVNRLRMFDQVNGTLTENASSIDVTVTATTVANGLALFNLDAQEVQVTVTNGSGTLYDETYSLRSTFGITDWYSWFTQEVEFKSNLVLTDLPPNSGTSVQVQITGTGDVACGTMVLGKLRGLGLGPMYGARGGITDYSRKTTDDFGNVSLTERAYAKRHTFRSMVANGDVDGVFDVLAQFRATPVVWIGHTDFSMTSIYGWARDWGIEIAYTEHSILALEIEGLT